MESITQTIAILKKKGARENFSKLPNKEEFDGLAEMFIPGAMNGGGAKLNADQCHKLGNMFLTLGLAM